jgi:lysyl-tRNA synthetase class 2
MPFWTVISTDSSTPICVGWDPVIVNRFEWNPPTTGGQEKNLANKDNSPAGADGAAEQESLHHLIETRLAKMSELGEQVELYPYSYERSHTSTEMRAQEKVLTEAEAKVSFPGRIMAKRGTGKTLFVPIQDEWGTIQAYFRKDDLGEDKFRLIQKLIDIGDWIGVEGTLFRTRTDELSIKVEDFTFLAKAIRALPEKFHDMSLENRSRRRHLDLAMNLDSRERFKLRSRIIADIRTFFAEEEFLEVETPVLQVLYGGATARPFITHHNALDMTLYMRIADELYLKRLIIGGLERVYEIAKDFRNEGMDRTHNPEFTMLECYAAYWDYHGMMDLTERMLRRLAIGFGQDGKLTYGELEMDFNQPFARVRFMDALAEKTGQDLMALDTEALTKLAKGHGVVIKKGMGRDKILDELFSELVEPELVQPTFVMDHPKELSPLAKAHRETDGLVERFELFIAGFEVANSFSELNDPREQRRRFEDQKALMEAGDDEAQPIDEAFLEAMEQGMPPTGGMGMGIDRLVMLLVDTNNIRDVLLFPHMRPEQSDRQDQPEGGTT